MLVIFLFLLKNRLEIFIHILMSKISLKFLKKKIELNVFTINNLHSFFKLDL